MRILFQGGWKPSRDTKEVKQLVYEYCKELAKQVITNDHELVLSSTRELDSFIAEEMQKIANLEGKKIKKHLLYLLSETNEALPPFGRVKKFRSFKWWAEERTYVIQSCDAVIAIGGGKGTYDCIEKAMLTQKPIFLAGAIPCKAVESWKLRDHAYKYITDGDADFLSDLTITPEEFFEETFSIINTLNESKYSKSIFIAHGRDYTFLNEMVELLTELGFEPIILKEEVSSGLTVIEKLERYLGKVGYGFVLYTPDDLGNLRGEPEKPRARQNVVFEHGLLIGVLGRNRTCALLKGDIEIPSDIHGMVYESISGIKNNKERIVKILKEAGYKIESE